MARSPSSGGSGSSHRGAGGGSDDKYRKSLVVADAARKRASWRYIHAGQPISQKLRYRLVEEYDRRMGGEGSSSGGRVCSPMRTPRNVLVIRDEPPPQGYDARAFASTISAEDFIPDKEMDKMFELICARTATEEKELDEQRRADAELLQAGLAQDRVHMERAAYWKQVAEDDAAQCIDLTSDAE